MPKNQCVWIRVLRMSWYRAEVRHFHQCRTYVEVGILSSTFWRHLSQCKYTLYYIFCNLGHLHAVMFRKLICRMGHINADYSISWSFVWYANKVKRIKVADGTCEMWTHQLSAIVLRITLTWSNEWTNDNEAGYNSSLRSTQHECKRDSYLCNNHNNPPRLPTASTILTGKLYLNRPWSHFYDWLWNHCLKIPRSNKIMYNQQKQIITLREK